MKDCKKANIGVWLKSVAMMIVVLGLISVAEDAPVEEPDLSGKRRIFNLAVAYPGGELLASPIYSSDRNRSVRVFKGARTTHSQQFSDLVKEFSRSETVSSFADLARKVRN